MQHYSVQQEQQTCVLQEDMQQLAWKADGLSVSYGNQQQSL